MVDQTFFACSNIISQHPQNRDYLNVVGLYQHVADVWLAIIVPFLEGLPNHQRIVIYGFSSKLHVCVARFRYGVVCKNCSKQRRNPLSHCCIPRFGATWTELCCIRPTCLRYVLQGGPFSVPLVEPLVIFVLVLLKPLQKMLLIYLGVRRVSTTRNLFRDNVFHGGFHVLLDDFLVPYPSQDVTKLLELAHKHSPNALVLSRHFPVAAQCAHSSTFKLHAQLEQKRDPP
mmetsp:Transcript_44164/g.82564  ORF Transcript_44164/g.82564 Transcript_44164/m.82564 type:complete len:229 (+) Transcript_44164:2670-3356(+)